MKLEEFKLLTLEERLDYLFEHSLKETENAIKKYERDHTECLHVTWAWVNGNPICNQCGKDITFCRPRW